MLQKRLRFEGHAKCKLSITLEKFAKNAWLRLKANTLFLEGKDRLELYLDSRRSHKENKLSSVIKRASTNSKSAGAEKLRLRAAESVVGRSKRQVLKATPSDHRYKQFNAILTKHVPTSKSKGRADTASNLFS